MGKNLAINITKADGTVVPLNVRRTTTAVTSAKQSWALNDADTVKITVQSVVPQTYDIGDTITVFGRDYRLNRLPSIKRTGAHAFQYDLEFEGVQYDLMRVTYDLTVDTTNNELQDVSGDSLTGDLERFLTVLVANANRLFPGKWAVGVVPETEGDKTLTFSESDNCLSVLQTLCNSSNFDKEFEIEKVDGVYTINIYDEVGQTLPYIFKYGRGGGMYELERKNVSSSNIVTRLKVYGSTDNITNKYRADRLCLPGKTKGQSYIEKADAVAKFGIFEARKNFDDIKPSHTGKVTALVEGTVLQFVDDTFPFDLNELDTDGETTKYLIAGQSAKVHFNTGNLAGYDFEVSKYDYDTHTFTLKAYTDSRGYVFPSETSAAFQFGEQDEYKITDITYPDDIVNEAEAELAEQANVYYDQNCQPKVQYGLSVTKSWLENLVGTQEVTYNIFAPGDYLQVVDDEVGVDKAIRIKSLERNLLDPYDYTLTISDITTGGSITSRVISDLVEVDKALTINNLKDPTKARANWRSSREVLSMVFDTEGDYYTEKIKPQSIDTIALSVGAKSMQFSLVGTVIEPNYQGNARVVKITGGTLTHYTIDEDAARIWKLSDTTITLDASNDSTPFYIYARCTRFFKMGAIILETAQHRVDESANYYYFLIGILNSVDSETNVRSIALTYGFTTINGRYIKTGRIESADGETYFDLDDGEIGGRIVFTQDGTTKTIDDLAAEALESKDYINNTLPGVLDEIQAQLDGQIEQFFYEYDPTMLNEPALSWSDTEKESHLGDLFYNTSTGKVWRFIKNSGDYGWQQLSDEETAQALALANEALSLSKEKNRIFTAIPTTPYDVGDLWVQGTTGDIMRCKAARASGSYTASDWEKASKYTDDTALEHFIDNNFADAISSLTNQIDGKIESWFQTTDPANSWTTDEERLKHVGDMWYDTSQKTLSQFVCDKEDDAYAFYWEPIESQTALDAYAAASAAQDTADRKRQVFTTTPYPPYDEGDLWVNGEEIRRCATARKSSESYNVNDWVECVKYDNTQTVIDGGIVTSGTIQVAGDKYSVLAGITGYGTVSGSVRFWAGASYANRTTAPFRVLQDGSLYATKARVKGTISATDGAIGGFIIGEKELTSSTTANALSFNSETGEATLAGGKLKVNADGSMTLNSVTVTNAVVSGTLNALNGLAYGTKTITGDYQMTAGDAFVYAAPLQTTGYLETNVYLPEVPNTGQLVTIANNFASGHTIHIKSNNHLFLGASSTSEYKEVGYRRVMQLLFTGTIWVVVNEYEN